MTKIRYFSDLSSSPHGGSMHLRKGSPYVEAIPGVNTQGRTLKEARANLKEALRLILEATSSGDERFFRSQDVSGSGHAGAEKEHMSRFSV